jgi:hypothetical protein
VAAAWTKYNNIGLVKERYADAPSKVLGKYAILKKYFPFEKGKKLGRAYHQAVPLTRPGGFTYTSANATTYTTLNTPIAPSIGDAYLEGSELIAQQFLTYKQLQSATDNMDSFGNALDIAVQLIMDEMDRKLEIDIIDGGQSLGKTLSGTATSTVLEAVVFTVQSWSAARWFGQENEQYNFYTGSSIVSSGADAVFTVYSVDLSTRTVTFSGTTTGCAALHSAVGGGTVSHDVYYNGSYGKRMQGLNSAATATSTLWGIDASAYSAWKGQTYTLATATNLVKSDLFKVAALAADKGATGELIAVLPSVGVANLLEDLSDLQRFEEKKGRNAYEIGADGIKIYSPAVGAMTIISHPLCRDGEGYMFPKQGAKLVGSTAFTWGRPGMDGKEEDMFFEHPTYDVVGMRAYGDLAAFHSAPGQIVKIASSATTTTL